MKKTALMVLLILAVAAAPALCEDVNIAPSCRVLVSTPANPAWDGKNLTDNDIGPTKGWLGVFDRQNPPWARFIMPYPAKVTKILVLPASFTELERRRFSRPKNISVLLKGDKSQVLKFDLKDDEDTFQVLDIGVDNIYELSIIINEVYPGLKYPDQTGFQEVEIMIPQPAEIISQGGVAKGEDSDVNPVDEAKKVLAKVQEQATDSQSVNTPAGTAKKVLSPDEKEILNTLRKLLKELEQKFGEE